MRRRRKCGRRGSGLATYHGVRIHLAKQQANLRGWLYNSYAADVENLGKYFVYFARSLFGYRKLFVVSLGLNRGALDGILHHDPDKRISAPNLNAAVSGWPGLGGKYGTTAVPLKYVSVN